MPPSRIDAAVTGLTGLLSSWMRVRRAVVAPALAPDDLAKGLSARRSWERLLPRHRSQRPQLSLVDVSPKCTRIFFVRHCRVSQNAIIADKLLSATDRKSTRLNSSHVAIS